jgi:hypothetical protein
VQCSQHQLLIERSRLLVGRPFGQHGRADTHPAGASSDETTRSLSGMTLATDLTTQDSAPRRILCQVCGQTMEWPCRGSPSVAGRPPGCIDLDPWTAVAETEADDPSDRSLSMSEAQSRN